MLSIEVLILAQCQMSLLAMTPGIGIEQEILSDHITKQVAEG